MTEATAVSTLQLETDRVRVTEWRFAPGAATGWHRPEFDYVVVPMTTGKLLLKEPGGERTADLTAGISYARETGVEFVGRPVATLVGGELAFHVDRGVLVQ